MKKFEHIRDCWNAIREAKTVSEVKDLFEEFPRWSGNWDITIEDETYVVVNTYEDENMGWQEDKETLDIEYPEEVSL